MYWLRTLLPQVTLPQAEREHAFGTFDRKLLVCMGEPEGSLFWGGLYIPLCAYGDLCERRAFRIRKTQTVDAERRALYR